MGSDPASALSNLGNLGEQTVVIPTNASGMPTDAQSEPRVSSSAQPREPIRVGELLDNKYRIERLIASSGMGIVYLATHLDIEQPVAIKFLLESRKDPQAMARFKREARAMGRVRNDHAVRVLDVDELDAETPFIVMEYLEGRDLHSLMREIGKLPLAFTCDLLLQACEALAAAHAEGVVHRDLKPSNIFVVPQADGTAHIKVIDFGIAKLRGEIDRGEAVTHTSTLVGSPRYMSPEQVANAAEVDHRSDVWALGVMLQEMLTGQRCFDAQGVGPLLVAISTRPPVAIRSILPDVPAGIVETLAKALTKNPAHRTPHVLAFAETIAPFTPTGPGRMARIRQVATRGAADPQSAKLSLEVPSTPELTSTASAVVEVPQRRRAGTGWITLAAAAIAFGLAAVTGAVFLVSRAKAPTAAAAAPPPTVAVPVPPASIAAPTTPATLEPLEDKPASASSSAAPSKAPKAPSAAPAAHPKPVTTAATSAKPADTKPRDMFDDPK